MKKHNKYMQNIRNSGHILFGVLLLFIASQLTIPTEPIPITLQTVAVMLIGLSFSFRIAMSIVLIYLGLGALGLPVFANYTGGIQKLFGPSGGYLWGFLVAVSIMIMAKKYLKRTTFLDIALNCLLGTLVIVAIGVFWLAHFVGFKSALNSGFYPFVIPGIAKIILASIIFFFLYPAITKGRR